MRLPRVFTLAFLSSLAESVFAGAVGFIVGALVLWVLGYNPILTFYYLLQGSVGSAANFSVTLNNAAPLILTAITFAIGLRAGLFNIGAEGQVYVGAAAAVAVAFISLPIGLHLSLSIVAAGVAGALWSLPAFVLKASRGVNEVISTIMLNWLGFYSILWVSLNWLVDPNRSEKTISAPVTMRFPDLLGGAGLSSAILFSVLVAFGYYAYLWLTPSGYELRAVGLNPDAAKFGGIAPKKALLSAFALGGVASGIAGAIQVAGRGPPYAIYTTLGNVQNFGFNGIGVSLIGRNHPVAIIVAGIFFGALQAGATNVQLYARVPYEIVQVIEGIIVVAIAAPAILTKIRGLGK